MPAPTKLDMKIQLRHMIADKEKELQGLSLKKADSKTKLNAASAIQIDIAVLKRCVALVEATMPEQMDIPPLSDLCVKDAHRESLRDGAETEERSH